MCFSLNKFIITENEKAGAMGTVPVEDTAAKRDRRNTPTWPEYHIHRLEEAIKHNKEFKGTFATSGLVNSQIRLVNDDVHATVVGHFRKSGYVVHAPPSMETWQKALEEPDRNCLNLLKHCYREPNALDSVILVEIVQP